MNRSKNSFPASRVGLLPSVLAALTVFVSGYSGISSPAYGAGPEREHAATSQWTTLGTRGKTSRPNATRTSHAHAQWSDYDPPSLYPGAKSQNVRYISLRDGVRLAAYVTQPTDASGAPITTPLPTILIQTPYNGGSAGLGVSALGGAEPYLVQHGYNTVVVDVRGTGQSQGSWEAFGPNEQADYAEVTNWVAQQSFCDGRIGVYGVSYLGTTTLFTAAQHNPAVKAAFSIVPVGDIYRDIVFTGGQIDATFVPALLGLVSVLGLIDPTVLTDPAIGIPAVLAHVESAVTTFQVPLLLRGVTGDPAIVYDGEFWRQRSTVETDSGIRVPTFIVGGLHDLLQRSEPVTYESVKRRVPAKLLIGPWQHLQAALGQGLPVDGIPVLNHIELRWFDQYIKGMQVGADKLPNVTQYVTGLDHYATATDWPHPQAAAQRLYLRGNGSLSETAPAANEGSNLILQQPIDGLCSISSAQWTAGILGFVPLFCFTDDNVAEILSVKYQTAPMSADYYLNGPIEADIWMTTTASDAGLSVRVDDVDENGNALALTNGLQTVSLRAVDGARSRTLDGQSIQPWHPYTQASVQPLTPGAPVLVPVEIFSTSALIRKGHSLRVAVGASDLPQGVPPLPVLLQSLIGLITVYSDAAHPSSVVIPVVPASALN